MLWVALNMGMSVSDCQGISECLESGHPDWHDSSFAFTRVYKPDKLSWIEIGPFFVTSVQFTSVVFTRL